MESGSTILDLQTPAHRDHSSGPQLLVRFEPAYRTFFRNLGYTLLGQPSERVQISSPPATHWNHIFLHSSLPWWALLESLLWHGVLVVLVLAVSKGEMRHQLQPQQYARSSPITYYPPTFPARESRPIPRPRSRTSSKSAASPAAPAMQVARETPPTSHSLVAPPDIAELTRRTQLPAATNADSVAPEMPLSATTPSAMKGLAGTVSVVAPAPEMRAGGGGRQNSMQVTVVAPPPELQASRSGRGSSAPGFAPIAPAPEVGRGTGGRRTPGVDVGRIEVVAPAPQMPLHGSGHGSGVSQIAGLGNGAAIVPPPPSADLSNGFASGRQGVGFGSDSSVTVVRPAPSMQDALGRTGRGTGGLPGSSGIAAVPPAPSIEGPGSATARGGSGIAGGSGLAVIPPAPSMEGAAGHAGRRGTGYGGGSGFGSTGLGGSGFGAVPPAPSLDGTGGGAVARRGGTGRGGFGTDGSGVAVVPPSPSIDGSGGNSRRGGRGFGGGMDMNAVPPAPSLSGTGNGGGNGRGTGLGSGNGRGMGMGSGSELAAVGPAPSFDGTGGSFGRGGMLADANPAVVPPPPSGEGAGQPPVEPGLQTAVEELHMRIVGLALALPSTSFASTYEVFIAERQLASKAVELIKLVYWFLPYQRRLTDYHPDYSKMYKLRATRDHACDESLQHMTISPNGEGFSSAQLSTLSPGFPNGNRDVMLPCYRTTADDYRRALSPHH